MGLAMAALAFAACSDEWDDHYKNNASGAVGETASTTQWQTISNAGNLTNFARVLQATGYDKVLNGAQVFTVFAPTDDNFTADEADAWIAKYNSEVASGVKDDDNETLKEFVKNHIALYNHSISSQTNEVLMMLNGKHLTLTNEAFGGQQITSSNRKHKNGLLYTIDGEVAFFSNVFEYLKKDAELDSVSNFLYHYNEYEFMPELSVEGGINENGQTFYLDSVSQLNNDMFSYLGRINSEDSTYWMVVPTNEEWARMYEEYSQYFNYDNETPGRDSLNRVKTGLSILLGTVFSKTTNAALESGDSAYSTNATPYAMRKYAYGSSDFAYYSYYNTFSPGGAFDGAERFECSNGQVLKSARWNIDKTQTFFQQLLINTEYSSRWNENDEDKSTTKFPFTTMSVNSTSPFYDKVSNNSYVEITGLTTSVNPAATFNIHNLLSNIPYDIYVVTVPAVAGNAYSTDTLPTIMEWSLTYNNQQGKATKEVLQSRISNNPAVVDTLLLASGVVIPTCSYDLEEPQVSMRVRGRVSNSQVRNGEYTRTMRIDCILFKPHEETETAGE